MKRLLLIEDEPKIRKNLETILTLEGFTVVTANDGHAGLIAARRERPDLILCDITMPVLDGYKVLGELRDDPELAGVPFIFLTARAALADLRAGMNLGADDYLPKPFTVDDLLGSIAARLARSSQNNNSRLTPRSPEELEKLGLTPREAQVLHWIAQGKSNPEIALILDMGLATVKTHLNHVFEKLGVENRTSAMLRALEGGDAG